MGQEQQRQEQQVVTVAMHKQDNKHRETGRKKMAITKLKIHQHDHLTTIY